MITPIFKKITPIAICTFAHLLICTFSSCRKADRDTDTSVEMIRDYSLATFCFNDVFKQAHKFALSDITLNSIYTSGVIDTSCIDTATHTNTPGFFPDTITVDFGSSNGTACSDGHSRRGKLQLIFTEKYNATLKLVTVIPSYYYVNDNRVEGKITISCRGENAAGNYYFSVNVSDGIITNDSMHLEYSATLQREWTSGEGTSDTNDDIFLLTGTIKCTASKGTVMESEITTALKHAFNCKWISSGKETVTPQNLSPRVVSYNNCSSAAVVTINGKDYDAALLP